MATKRDVFTVRFEDVGARHLTWEEPITRPVTDVKLIKAIKRKGALCSRGIDVVDTGDYAGAIYVGMFRRVGTYFIVPPVQPPREAR